MAKKQRTLSATPMMQNTGLRIYLLGPMRIEQNGLPIRLPRRKVESLLAFLILRPEQHLRDHLATLFWGDSSDTQARHSLRTALATVRQLVSTELLLADREHIQLNPSFPLWVDLYQLLGLEKLVDHASGELPLADLDLWQGELLAGFYDEWVTTEREHYGTRLLKLFLQVTQALRAASAYTQAIAVAQRVLTLDPTNEHAHQHLMFCYVAAGDRPAALRQYELCERVLADELDVSPMPETTALYEWIKQRDGDESSPAGKITNLPIPLTSFVGRTRESAEVKRLLSRTHKREPQVDPTDAVRLLTLTGAGGTGKTRLSIQVATDLIDSFAHGVWWVELAALSDDDLVGRAVAKTLGVNEVNGEATNQTVAKFINDKQMLLVIDNCEHLVAPCANLAAELLARAPNLQILATSREPLNITGEVLWQVPTFAAPDPTKLTVVDLLMQFESLRLFVERATTVQPSFALTPENAQAVAEICQRLDGIPLAIELAAARVKLLAVEQIAEYLTRALGARFSLLTQGNRAALPRHQTLRATIDWSYALLDEGERLLFRQLAIFRGGFTLEALEEIVASKSDGPPGSKANIQLPFLATLELLSQLVDKSLVIVEPQGGHNRYRLLETLREYAAEQLHASGEESLWRERHAQWFLNLAKRAAPELEGAKELFWLDHLESEHDNLRAALAWYAAESSENEHRGAESGLQLSCAIFPFWSTRSYLSEGQRWLETFLSRIDPETAQESQVDAMNQLGRIAFLRSNFHVARTHYERSLDLARTIEYDDGVEKGLNGLGISFWELGDFQNARTILEEAVRFARAVQHLNSLARALNNLSLVCMNQGDHEATRAHLHECLALNRQLGDKSGIATVLFNLAITAENYGDYAQARQLYGEAQAIDRERGDRPSIADGLHNMGMLAVSQGELAEAAAHFQEAEQIYREIGAIGDTAYIDAGLGDIAFYQGDYSEAYKRHSEALALFREAGNQRLIGRVLGQLGRIACRQGDLVLAAEICGAALTLRRTIGHKPGMILILDQGFVELAMAIGQPIIAARILGAVASARTVINRPRSLIETLQLEPILALLREQLGDAAMAVAWAEGEAMKLEEVTGYALASLTTATVLSAKVPIQSFPKP